MQFIIQPLTAHGNYCLTVFNCGYRIAIHNSQSRKYIKRVIRKYTDRMASPSHAAHGKAVQVAWN